MPAVDTNVLVRLLTHDDPRQAERATALFAHAAVFIPKTVILETAWVLRRLYGFSPPQMRTRGITIGSFTVASLSSSKFAKSLPWALGDDAIVNTGG